MTQPQSVIRSTFSVTAVTRNGTETETAEGVRETTETDCDSTAARCSTWPMPTSAPQQHSQPAVSGGHY